jgi:hypothetical protein
MSDRSQRNPILARSLLIISFILISAALTTLLPIAQAEQKGNGFLVDANSSYRLDEPGLERSLAGYDSLELAGISLQHNNSSRKDDCYLIFLGEKGEKNTGDSAAKNLILCLKTFLIGLSRDNSYFWVNLNPSEPNRIVDAQVGRTDVGRIMLNADYQMKKDFADYLNPCQSKIGQDYWMKVGAKQNELVEELRANYSKDLDNQSDILFQAAVRNWIVPGALNVSTGNDGLYLLNYSLRIEQEPADNYSTFILDRQNKESLPRACLESLNVSARNYGHFAARMQLEMALPEVAKDVNTEEKYSDLRRVYKSLAVAQWYKNQTSQGLHPLDDWSSVENSTWSPLGVWQNYVLSFREGDVNCWMTTNTTIVYNTTYNLTQNDTYNVTHEATYYISSNNTTVVRGSPPVIERNLSTSQRNPSLEYFVNMGTPKYQSWLEQSGNESISSEYYTIGGVDYSKILPYIRIAEDLNPTIRANLLPMATAKIYVTYPGSEPSTGNFGFVVIDQTSANGLLRKTTEGTIPHKTGDLYILANTWYFALLRDWRL